MLGVVEQFRGRGLAKFLLVDTNNPTPALGLYLSVGMKPTLVVDGWRRVLTP